MVPAARPAPCCGCRCGCWLWISAAPSAAGGGTYTCEPRIWVTGDLLVEKSNVYGLQGLPVTGGGPLESYHIDLDGDVIHRAATQIGDVQINGAECGL